MATTTWYVGADGSDLNSGGSNSAAARVTRDAGTPGTVAGAVLTDAGATFITSGVLVGDAVNLQIAGVSTIVEILSVDLETQITFTTSPGNGSYNYRIGGRRPSLLKTVENGAGENARITAADTVYVTVAGTYTENTITPAVSNLWVEGTVDGVIIDGTGGAAGSDIWVLGVNTTRFVNITFQNAVDHGIMNTSGGTQLNKCKILNCGGKALNWTQAPIVMTTIRGCAAGVGQTGITLNLLNCEISECTGRGVESWISGQIIGCLFFDMGSDAIYNTGAASAAMVITGCTIEGSTGDGMELAHASAFFTGSVFMNNLVTNNAVGVNASVAQTSLYTTDYNDFFGNGTARTNFNTGPHDTAVDPQYTAVASDDYSIKAAGGAFKTGYSPFKNPTLNALNIGAIAGPGSAEETGDYPAAGDVRAGTSYANGTLTGTMVASSGFLGWPLG